MAHVIKDKVAETSTTTGTGALTLAGAITGYKAFSDVMTSPSDTCHYTITGIDADGIPTGEWETGLGTYSGVNTLTRTTVIASSNSDAAVTFSAGTKRVTMSLIAAGIATEASASEIWTGSETAKYISPDKLFDAAAPQTLTDAATIAVDMATGINFNVTLGGNRTLGNPTNAKPGQSGRIRVTQDGTGSRTLAYGANWKHVGSAPTISTAASAVDLFAYFVNGTSDIELSYLGALA